MSGWPLIRTRARITDTVATATAVALAALCLIPLFSGLDWLPPCLLVIVVVAVIGAASRAVGLPLPLVPLAEAMGVIATVCAMFASDHAWAWLVPTGDSLSAVRAIAQQGVLDAQNFGPPVATLPGLVLLAVGGVGLVALSADSLFVSIRSPVLAGLALVELYLAPAFMLDAGAPWWSLAPPAAGWLLIVAADQRSRMREWAGAPPSMRIGGMSPVARRTAAIAILSAMVVALVVPLRDTSAPQFSGGGTGPAVSGGPVVLDPLVSLRRSLIEGNDTEILRYGTDDPSPTYLRVTALESFDGQTWRPRAGLESGRDPGWSLPGPVTTDAQGPRTTYDITVTNLSNAYLPLPYPVSDIENADDSTGLASDWRLDPTTGIAFSEGRPATGLSYRVTAIEPVIRPDALRDASPARGAQWPQLNLPANLPDSVGRLAREVTADQLTNYDRALALQRWFTRDGDFRYSTSVRSGADADYLGEFLVDRVGYCEQFAATMAVMARSLGIPSRVVVGFTQGAQGEDGTWSVTVRDAHAWPELWFDGIGWVRFEPTPRSGATVLAPDYAPTPAGDSALEGRPEGLNRGDVTPVDSAPGDTGTLGTAARVTLAVLGAILLGLLLLAVPMARRLLRRRRRLHARAFADVVEGAWAEIADTALDLGQPWSPGSTVRQAAGRLSRGMDQPAADALRRLRSEVEQLRYGRRPGPTASGEQAGLRERAGAVRADVRTVVSELRSRVRWQTRWASYCWPSSERRRQRSSMRSMKPGDLALRGADAAAGASGSTAAGAWKAE